MFCALYGVMPVWALCLKRSAQWQLCCDSLRHGMIGIAAHFDLSE